MAWEGIAADRREQLDLRRRRHRSQMLPARDGQPVTSRFVHTNFYDHRPPSRFTRKRRRDPRTEPPRRAPPSPPRPHSSKPSSPVRRIPGPRGGRTGASSTRPANVPGADPRHPATTAASTEPPARSPAPPPCFTSICPEATPSSWPRCSSCGGSPPTAGRPPRSTANNWPPSTSAHRSVRPRIACSARRYPPPWPPYCCPRPPPCINSRTPSTTSCAGRRSGRGSPPAPLTRTSPKPMSPATRIAPRANPPACTSGWSPPRKAPPQAAYA